MTAVQIRSGVTTHRKQLGSARIWPFEHEGRLSDAGGAVAGIHSLTVVHGLLARVGDEAREGGCGLLGVRRSSASTGRGVGVDGW